MWALDKEMLCTEITNSFIHNQPLPEALHFQALEIYKLYLIVGGMPAPVKKYIETRKLVDIPELQNQILNNYASDMSKYASNSESVKIRGAFHSIPNQLAKDNKKFQYKVVEKGGSASMFGVAIDWLCFAGVVLKCQKLEHAMMPIAVYTDLSSFKLYMGDVGLLAIKAGIPYQLILSNLENNNVFFGALAENYVAEELTANGHKLYYWESKSIAKVDFVLQQDDKIIPIEVKSGVRTRSKSLSVFVEKYKVDYSIRISARNFGFENKIKAVPLYAVYNI